MRTISSPNRTVMLAGASVLLASMSVPGLAQTSSRPDGASMSASAHAERNDRRAGGRKICIRGEITGSRIQRQVCKTEDEWRAQGEVPGGDRLQR